MTSKSVSELWTTKNLMKIASAWSCGSNNVQGVPVVLIQIIFKYGLVYREGEDCFFFDNLTLSNFQKSF